jgi:hypothetical protein
MTEVAIRAYARDRRFGDKTVKRWLAQEDRDAAALLALAQRLRLGENQLLDVLEALEDVAGRQGGDFRSVLEHETVRPSWQGTLGRNEAIKALKSGLRQLRFPQLGAAERRLQGLAKRLALPAGVRLQLPPNLEGGWVDLSIRAGSAPQLRRQLEALSAAVRRPEVEEIFDVLDGVS